MERWFPCTLFLGGGWLLYRKTISASRGSRENHLTGAERLFSPFTFHFSPFTFHLSLFTMGMVAGFPNCRLVGRLCFMGNDIRLRRTISMLRMDDIQPRAAERYPRAGARGKTISQARSACFHLSLFTMGMVAGFPNCRFVGRLCSMGNDIRLRRTISMLRMDDIQPRGG